MLQESVYEYGVSFLVRGEFFKNGVSDKQEQANPRDL